MADQPINEKNTKSEILKAYDELLQKVRESRQPNRGIERAAEEKRAVISLAQDFSADKIIKDLAELKLSTVKSFDVLQDQILEEHKKLLTVQQAIFAERKTLEETHEIRANADSLAALLLGQKEKRADFDFEMTEKRASWKKEQEVFETNAKETKDRVRKEWVREEDEHKYKTEIERTRDADQYAARKAALETELAKKKETFDKSCVERETHFAARETELKDLNEKVATFPSTLETAVANTEKRVAEQLALQHKYQFDVTAKEVDGELRLLKQTISSLESKIKEKDSLIAQLTAKTNEASLQVQDIAVKAIEGASSSRTFAHMFQRQGEQEKTPKA